MTGLIASIPLDEPARRTALANLVINVSGVLLFLPFIPQLTSVVNRISDEPGTAVAWGHLIFNVVVAVIAMPLLGPLARLLEPGSKPVPNG